MALRTLPRRLVGSIFHVKAPTPKHVENSDRGDRHAKRIGKRAIDLDLQMTSDRQVVNTHWARPMVRDGFRDPYGKIQPHKMIRELTWDEVSRLVAGRWPRRYRIRTVEHALHHCARLNLIAVLEPKGDPRFREDWVWQHIAKVADAVGCTVSVYALPQNLGALEAAKRAGFQGWEIR